MSYRCVEAPASASCRRSMARSSSRRGLATPYGPAHPCSNSLDRRHASHAGFCTPGFRHALFALYLNRSESGPGRSALCTCGNLCRCTVYFTSSTRECGMELSGGPCAWSAMRHSRSACRHLEGHRSRPCRGARPGRGGRRCRGAEFSGYHAPRTLAELSHALVGTRPRDASPAPRISVSGSPRNLLEFAGASSTWGCGRLNCIEPRPEELWERCGITSQMRGPRCSARPELRKAARFASRPFSIRNLCGNLATLAIGDSIPA